MIKALNAWFSKWLTVVTCRTFLISLHGHELQRIDRYLQCPKFLKSRLPKFFPKSDKICFVCSFKCNMPRCSQNSAPTGSNLELHELPSNVKVIERARFEASRGRVGFFRESKRKLGIGSSPVIGSYCYLVPEPELPEAKPSDISRNKFYFIIDAYARRRLTGTGNNNNNGRVMFGNGPGLYVN